MLKLDAFVDDKKAAKVLHVLDGLVRDLTLVPVRNVKVHNSKIAEAGVPTTAPQVVHKMVMNCRKAHKDGFTNRELIPFAETYGISKEALQYGVTQNEKA